MGNIFDSYFDRIWTCRLQRFSSVRVLMLGLDGAGKTTILNMIKVGKVIETVPTIGFNL